MKTLKQLLTALNPFEIAGNPEVTVSSVCIDSRKVESGSCFVAISGTKTNGSEFIDAAIANGAVAIVCTEIPSNKIQGITYVQVEDTSDAAGKIASAFFGKPSEQLTVVGVTGTNGKTSVATMLYHLYTAMGFKSGLISTVENRIGEVVSPSTHTTPDAVSLQQLFAQMLGAGCSHVFMEVSSHAIDQKRISGTRFKGAVFTNITHDHLDYHLTFDNYIKAKKGLFTALESGAFALLNADDRHSKVMTEHCKVPVFTYALRNAADYKVRITESTAAGLTLEVNGKEVHTAILGEFNAYNLAAVYGVARQLGMDEMDALTGISAVAPPEGRMERVKHNLHGFTAIVDYAHTPDALRNVLQTIRSFRTGNEQLITVVGCGGNRDQSKRPLMAGIATHFSDRVFLTSDNPRYENPETILEEMFAGIPVEEKRKAIKITDRKEAIRAACLMSNPGDILLVAGKGHEKYQEINGVKHPFHDRKVIQDIIQELIHQ